MTLKSINAKTIKSSLIAFVLLAASILAGYQGLHAAGSHSQTQQTYVVNN